MGEAIARGLRLSFRELLVHRIVAFTARRGGARTFAPEALETDDERDDRDDKVDTSETMESGDDADEVDRAKDDRRTVEGYPSKELTREQNESGGR